MNKFCLYILLSLLLLNACSKNKDEISIIKESRQDLEMMSAYLEGYESLNKGDPYFAAKKFLEAELLFPQSEWAPRSALMASYAYYQQNFYVKALENLERFLITYPNSSDLVYAHYLIGMCYYETIVDEKRDSNSIIQAKKKFGFIVKNYPNTDFALDSQFKLDLIEDILASKEMYLGRHYLKKRKWIASMNRFKNILENYDKTIFTEEALHRLVEINYKLGLIEESQKYASILGYNYQSSNWYKKSYKIFNKDYSEQIPKIKKDKKGVINKFKKLFERNEQ
jgi:outer membrane protein assembly factor BamD